MTGSHEVVGSIPISSTMKSETGLRDNAQACFGLYGLSRRWRQSMGTSPGAERHPLPLGEGLAVGQVNQAMGSDGSAIRNPKVRHRRTG